ncbi:uncharacterized protein STEHIDRAFT_159374 [Stereum hirsutum FP-91666 SS1]|uniref:uncharacterized protein n=1 Tax=Stereum hirsutum (strain FP-91666) TaxID=721885 RepID=UPI000444A316|nr:uncharacterized protein STEHIDRAFT_159374 [Stereum hirsutum FP-91666 SS1]EIM83750.1 hypothetical protein STEHIDRAFT_159374 [Stereum hirsutum FP-91666 SS1]
MGYPPKKSLNIEAAPFVPQGITVFNDSAIGESGSLLSSPSPNSASDRAPPGLDAALPPHGNFASPLPSQEARVSDWRARGPQMTGSPNVTPSESRFKVYTPRNGVFSPGAYVHEKAIVDDRSDSEDTLAAEVSGPDTKASDETRDAHNGHNYIPPARRDGTDTGKCPTTEKYIPPAKRVDPVLESYKSQRAANCQHDWMRGARYEKFEGSECWGCSKRWPWLYKCKSCPRELCHECRYKERFGTVTYPLVESGEGKGL